jgi:hypothetical protein
MREGGHAVTRVGAIKAEAVPSSSPAITGSSALADDDNRAAVNLAHMRSDGGCSSDNVVTDQRPSNMAAQRLSVSSGTSGKPW